VLVADHKGSQTLKNCVFTRLEKRGTLVGVGFFLGWGGECVGGGGCGSLVAKRKRLSLTRRFSLNLVPRTLWMSDN